MSYQVRVWLEDGTLLGYATANGATVHFYEVPENSSFSWKSFTFSSPEGAEWYINEWADGYAAYCRETCDCGEEDCGVLNPHGVSIQYVRGGLDVSKGG